MATMRTRGGLAKIDKDSRESVHAGLDVFGTPFSHTSILGGAWTPISPTRENVSETVEFEVPGSDDRYLDLANTYLCADVKVTKRNGAELPAVGDGVYALGDNFFHSLFSTASVKLNGQDVEYESNYPHRAFVETLLNRSEESKRTQLFATSGWIEDSGVGVDFAQTTVAVKAARKLLCSESKTLSFYGKLHLSIFAQERLLFPGLGFRLAMRRSSPTFCLSAAAEDAGAAAIAITKIELHVRSVKVNPAVQKVHTSILHSQRVPLKFPMHRVKTQFHVVSAGVHNAKINLEQNGQRPNRVIVGIVDHEAKTGVVTRNPFRFQHSNLSSLELLLDGIPVGRRLEPNFTTNSYARSFMSALASVGKADSNFGNGITYEKFANGAAIYSFDNSGDLCGDEEGGSHLVHNGSMTLALGFSAAPTRPLSVFVYQTRDELVTVSPEFVVSMINGAM